MAKDVIKAFENLKVSGNFFDLFLAGVVKYFEERLMIPIVGDGNFISGASKLGVGLLIEMFGSKAGRMGNVVKTAFVLDGVEDLTKASIEALQGKVPALNFGMAKTNEIPTI